MITYLTAGESHGKALSAIIEGLPANLKIDLEFIDHELARRQLGFGRGGRMSIEQDKAEILSGLRDGLTIGSPISFLIMNKDWENWSKEMDPCDADIKETLSAPRPGHADLTGALKTGQKDLRNILERSSARQTATYVGVGAFAKVFLKEFGVEISSHVTAIGDVKAKKASINADMLTDIDASPVRTADKEAEAKMVELIKKAQKDGDTLGGSFEVVAEGVIPGLGNYSLPKKRLDGRLCGAIVSIPAIKAAAVGEIDEAAFMAGSKAHDEIYYDARKGYYHKTNRAGGIEGGMSNGSDIILKALMKPIPTLSQPLKTIDMKTKKQAHAFKERHDTVAVAAAAVIGEAALAIELADVFIEKFGSDSIEDIKANFENYRNRLKSM